jgi:hypothetical protein
MQCQYVHVTWTDVKPFITVTAEIILRPFTHVQFPVSKTNQQSVNTTQDIRVYVPTVKQPLHYTVW